MSKLVYGNGNPGPWYHWYFLQFTLKVLYYRIFLNLLSSGCNPHSMLLRRDHPRSLLHRSEKMIRDREADTIPLLFLSGP